MGWQYRSVGYFRIVPVIGSWLAVRKSGSVRTEVDASESRALHVYVVQGLSASGGED